MTSYKQCYLSELFETMPPCFFRSYFRHRPKRFWNDRMSFRMFENIG